MPSIPSRCRARLRRISGRIFAAFPISSALGQDIDSANVRLASARRMASPEPGGDPEEPGPPHSNGAPLATAVGCPPLRQAPPGGPFGRGPACLACSRVGHQCGAVDSAAQIGAGAWAAAFASRRNHLETATRLRPAEALPGRGDGQALRSPATSWVITAKILPGCWACSKAAAAAGPASGLPGVERLDKPGGHGLNRPEHLDWRPRGVEAGAARLGRISGRAWWATAA